MGEVISGSATYFLDSNVFLAGLDAAPRRREQVGGLLTRLRQTGGDLATSSLILEEVFHVAWRLSRDRRIALRLVAEAGEAGVILAVRAEEHRRAMLLANEVSIPAFSSKDYYHAAVMLNHGIRHIVSYDRDFDRFPGIVRLDPGRSS